MTRGDAEFVYPIAARVPVINRDSTLKLNNGGKPCSYSGPISGSGKVEIYAGGQNAPLTLDGKSPNTMQGTWIVKAGRLVLAKPPGVDALGGTIIVSGQGDHNDLLWNGNNQINHAAHIQLLSSDHGTASLNLNGFSDTIGRLTLVAGTKVFTSGPQGGGVLSVRELWVDGRACACPRAVIPQRGQE